MQQQNLSLVEHVYQYVVTNNNLEYLIQQASQSFANFEIIKWALEAFINDPIKADEADSRIMEAIVNKLEENKQPDEAYLDKSHKSNYINSIQIFVSCLTQLSLQLKNIPVIERDGHLKINLIKANRAIESYRRLNPENPYSQGIILPFEGHSQLVVRIIDTEAQSFNTKKRVPYKIVVETVDLKEIIEQPPSFRKQISVDTQAFMQFDPFQETGILENFLNSDKDIYAKQQKINQQRKRFDQQFPAKKLSRRGSCINKIQKYNQKQVLDQQLDKYEQKKLDSDRDEQINVDFVNYLRQKCPNHPKLIEYLESIQIQPIHQEITQFEDIEKPFVDQWKFAYERIKSASPFSNYKSYKLRTLLIKGGDDLRQEYLMMEILKIIENIFQGQELFIRTYQIIITSADSGILEFINDTLSVDALKKKCPGLSLLEIFQKIYGENFQIAQRNFILSLAPYSIIQYLFQIKDRHNEGNILIDNQGHIIHIDFGFIFSIAPGGIGFENAPFKLTKEYIELIGGKDSDLYTYYYYQLVNSFIQIRQKYEEILNRINIMNQQSDLPCFQKFDQKEFTNRFRLDLPDDNIENFIKDLLSRSAENKKTSMYDSYQKMTNGIIP
ncbi:Phosphatidylinositol 4-kinase beta [Paramecium bursaria]